MDISHVPHPVLMHLWTFFDLWDAFVLQALQSGQPYISDHIMFEVWDPLLTESKIVYSLLFYNLPLLKLQPTQLLLLL